MTSIETTLRNARMLQLGFLVAAALFLFQLRILKPAEHKVSPIIIASISLVSVSDIGIAIFFRKKLIKGSEERLRGNPDDMTALGKWRKGVIMSFTYAETVVLFGFVLKFLGARWNIAGPFFALGILLLLAWRPTLDLSAGS